MRSILTQLPDSAPTPAAAHAFGRITRSTIDRPAGQHHDKDEGRGALWPSR
jgi:hypothetical protein